MQATRPNITAAEVPSGPSESFGLGAGGTTGTFVAMGGSATITGAARGAARTGEAVTGAATGAVTGMVIGLFVRVAIIVGRVSFRAGTV